MINLNDIEGTRNSAKAWVDDGLDFCTTPVKYGDLLKLTERLLAAEQDAERYRWIRRTEAKLSGANVEEMDAKIDEAMSAVDKWLNGAKHVEV